MSHASEKSAFRLTRIIYTIVGIYSSVLFSIVTPLYVNAQAPNLGVSSGFALFTGAGAFNSVGASTVVTGDAGTNVGAFNAFPPGILIGTSHVADAVTAQAAAVVLTAYMQLGGLTCDTTIGTTMGSGQILTPKIYCLGGASTINGNLVLDAQGNPNAIFIFKINGALSTTTLSNVSLINSASICNVFWQINGAVSLGNSSTFIGTMLVNGAISLLQGARLDGRGLSTSGAISLADNTVTTVPNNGTLPVSSIISGPTTFCVGDSITLSGNNSGVWSTGALTASITVKNPGTYYVVNSNVCGRDTSNRIIVTYLIDNILPTITCPPNLTVAQCEGIVTFANPATNDNCPGVNTMQIQGLVSGSTYPVGITTNIFRATDAATNSATCSFTVTVTSADNSPPKITCPSEITMATDPDRCNAVVCFSVSATDNCSTVLPISLANHTYIGTYNGHTYFRSNLTPTGILSWEQSNAAAVSLGGHLVSINNQAEQTFLNNNIPNNALNQFWIGLRYSPSLNLYKWTSGEPVNFFNWGIGQPINIPLISGDYVYHLEVGNPAAEGWYNLLGLVPRRYIVEFEGLPVQLISGLPSGSIFPVGTTSIIYQVTDLAGNTARCSFNVVVQDIQKPIISCPPNQTLNILRPSVCDTIATWGSIISSDNCSWNTTRIGLNLDKERGSVFPVGVYPISYQVTDASNNTATCSFTVTVNDFNNPSLGCKKVNLSLAGDCKGVLEPTDVLNGWEHISGIPQLGCDSLYKIKIFGSNGQNLGDTLRFDQLGKTLNYSIMHPSGFTCWNTVLIEDKIKPSIICRNDTINCIAPLSSARKPIATDNCLADVVQVDEKYEKLNCSDFFVGYYARTWKAVDRSGNESLTVCNDTVFLRRTSLIGIVFPRDTLLSCSGTFPTDGKGFPFPNPATSTGVPRLGNISLYPFQSAFICSGIVDYSDVLVVDTKCKKMIQRFWKIQEWHCDTLVVINMPPQVIQIVDTIAPGIPQQLPATFTTQSRSCKGLVTFPRLNITDNCNNLYHVFINVNNGIPTGYIDGNGGTLELGVGGHSVTYTAIDECGNKSTMQYRILVEDDTDPVALCDQFATISLKTNGYTEITATAVDDGSYDACGTVTLKIRRMEDPCAFGADTAWFDKVGFCCLDANTTRMVQLLVTDQSNNTNICMVSVQVQDKINPGITCPADITIDDCLFTFDKANPTAYFGAVTVSDNCPSNNTLVDSITSDGRTQCGTGMVIRTVSVKQGNTTFATCTQRITFRNLNPFYINAANPLDPNDDIVWPRDTLFTGQCSPIGLDTSITGAPKLKEDACDMVGMRYDDQVFPFTTNGACYKIIRTWTVMDWCQRNTNNTVKTWTFQQEIKVMDRDKPELTLPGSLTFTTLDCTSDIITLTASATDCTPAADLRWTWVIRQGNTVVSSGTGSSVTDEFDLGEYSITWNVEDRCGNNNEGSYNFRIVSTKAANAVCKQGLAAPLVIMDTNGDGTGDSYMAMLRPQFFDNKSAHTCGVPIRLSFSANVLDTVRIYTCDSVGVRTVRLYVTDIYGNQSYCQTFVTIQATNAQCPNVEPLLARVGGTLKNENNDQIEDVFIELKGSEQNAVKSDKNGSFSFAPMAVGGAYELAPVKDGDDLNGVSTLDIVMIQRHILGIEKLKTPYQIIAADANNTGSVTAADLIELRKLVLGLIPSLPTNTSWRFIDGTFKFPNLLDPWMTHWTDKYNIDKLKGNMDVNFIGIKVGDVNGNAKSKNVGSNVTETRSKVVLNVSDIKVNRGDVIEIPMVASSAESIYGMQAQLKANGLIIREIKSGQLKFRFEDVVFSDVNEAKMCIVVPEGVVVNKNEVLFIIEAEILKSGRLSEMLQIGTGVTPEIYTAGMETKNPVLKWRDQSLQEFMLTSTAPNPWNSQTMINFELPATGMVTFKVKDYTGRKVLSTIDQYQAGRNTIQINRADIGQSGVYVYEIRYDGKVLSGKMIVID